MYRTKVMGAIVFSTVLAANTANAQTTYTFDNVVSNAWQPTANWTPNTGPPVAGDTAIIPSGETCIVKDADQAAKIIQVSGTLGIEGKFLTLGDDSNGTTSTLSGTLYFTKVSSTVAQLRIKNTVTLTGSGTITAKADAGREGVITVSNTGTTDDVLVVPSGMTLEGTLSILAVLDLDGTAVVDDADDVMELGDIDAVVYGSKIQGDGSFNISAGLLRVRVVFFQTSTPKWTLSGGTIQVTDDGNIFGGLKIPITMTGGTLDFDQGFQTTAECIFSGGKIDVANGKCAEFLRPT